WDLYDCDTDHLTAVVPATQLRPGDPGDPSADLTARTTSLVVGVGATPARTAALLRALAERLAAAGLAGAPLTSLAR
ncbi:MAG TPA: hypothetical protein VFP61_10200, partial [Acidimicrobiales bacterium]|nr:hypothetical protein [Acidimicrobiales bacterium]